MRLFLLITFLLIKLTAFAQVDSTGTKLIKGVIVSGNKITKERIILRELAFEVGDTLTAEDFREKCIQSQSLLYNTRLFNFVSVIPVFTENDAVYAKVEVQERWYWWPEVRIRFADPNFNTWWETKALNRLNAGVQLYKQNFRGRNEDLRIKTQFGYTREFGLSYRLPFISRKQRMGLRIAGSYREQEEITVGTVDNRRVFYREDGIAGRTETFVELELSYRPKLYGKHSLALGLVNAEVRDSLASSYTDYFDNEKDHLNYLKMIYSFRADRRDNRGYPLKGDYFQFDLEQRGMGLINKDGLFVTKVWAQYKRYFALGGRWYYGAGLSLNSSLFGDLPYYIQQGLGYAHNLRGYEYYIQDGQHFALLRSNFKYALVPRRELDLGFGPSKFTRIHYGIYLNAFFDTGRVWDQRYDGLNPLSNDMQYSTGLGLDFSTYYDAILRVEFALNKLNETGFFLHFVQPI